MKGIFNSFETIDGQYMVDFNEDARKAVLERVPLEKIGSWNVLPARILGLSYAEYLRYARDKYNGKIYGKGHKYPLIKFDNKWDCNNLCKELWRRWDKL